jgi:hypothetical protein
VLGDLEHKSSSSLVTRELDLEGVEDGREVVRVEVDIDDGTNDGLDGTGLDSRGGSVGSGGGCGLAIGFDRIGICRDDQR